MRRSLLLLALLSSSAAAVAQPVPFRDADARVSGARELLHALRSPHAETDGKLGARLAAVPDTDGDGYDDLLVATAFEDPGASPTDAGRVYLYSGATGTLLFELQSPHEEFDGRFGRAAAGVPDVDGDGRGDLLVGAYYEDAAGLVDAGRAYLFSGATGALLRELSSPNAQDLGRFGVGVAGVPDVNGDGRGDLLVGAFTETALTEDDGRAYVFSGATGALLFTLISPSPEVAGNFGYAVAAVPDANGDGRSDLLVGAPNEDPFGITNAGRAYLFSGATGTLLHTLISPNPAPASSEGSFGRAVAGVPDTDGDGLGDLLVGAREDNPDGSPENAGRAYLFRGKTGALLLELQSSHEELEGHFGESVAGVPDADGDGRGDLLVGAYQEDPGASPENAGRAYLFSGASGVRLQELQSPNEEAGGFFGFAVAGASDTDGDDRGDLLVGAAYENPGEGPDNNGRAYLFSGGSVAPPPVPFVEDFTSVLVQGAERSIAALWGDADSDGDLDLLVTDVEDYRLDDLFRNDGDGNFTLFQVPTNEDHLATTAAGSIADYNDDGFLDLASASLNDGSLYINQPDRGGLLGFRYRPSRIDDYEDVREATAADFNGDGRVDVLLVRRSGQHNILVQSDGDRGIALHGGDVYGDADDSDSACWGDVNNDGFPDLFIANLSPANRYYINDGSVLIRDTSQPFLNLEGRSVGCSWGDYDEDGDLDLAVTLDQTTTAGGTQLFRNDAGSFVSVSIETRPLDSSGSAWGDVDNDGDLDLVVAHRQEQSHTLYRNEGDGSFMPLDFGDSMFSVALTLVDDDEDGDLDLFITNGQYVLMEPNQLFRNSTDGGGNWLEVDLRRSSGRNRFGVGAHVYVYATVAGVPRTLLREVQTLSGVHAQNGNRLHFGLGDATVIDSLVVEWPRGVDEDRTVLYDVAVNQSITVGGSETAGSEVAAVAEESTEATEATAAFTVEGVNPNPSRGDVMLTVRSGDDAPVRVEVLDILGRRIRSIEIRGETGARMPILWDGTDEQGHTVAAGLYLLCVRQGANEEVVKVTLLR